MGKKMNENTDNDLLERMKDLAKSGSSPTQAPINSLAILPCFAELLVTLADKQEESSKRMEKQTNLLIALTIILVLLTVGLLFYTIILCKMTANL